MEIEYKYNENTPLKEIALSACEYIALHLENIGYKFFKSKKEIIKNISDLEFKILFFSSDYNKKGYKARITVDCIIFNKKYDELYYGNNLGYIAAIGYKEWELYGKDNYGNSLNKIIHCFDKYFIPLTNRFIDDIDNLVLDVVNNGFYPNNKQVGYEINVDFLKRYGNKELLEKAIQKYYNSISVHYEANKKFKKLLIDSKNGIEIEATNYFYKIIKAIAENNLNIIIKE
jgi:hypothetical protein